MDDLISRKAALEAVRNMWGIVSPISDEVLLIDKAQVQTELMMLPTAEQRKGKWIVDGEFIDCSVCRKEKWSRVPYESLVRGFRYCPKCGARMEESDG